MKKLLVIMMAVCMLATLGLATAQASWFTCNVNSVGTTNQGASALINLTATNGTFTKWWFTLSTTNTNQQLATALTAMSTGIPVLVYFGGTGAPPGYAIVNSMYLNNGL